MHVENTSLLMFKDPLTSFGCFCFTHGVMLSTIYKIPSSTSALAQPGQTEPDQNAGTDLAGTEQPLSQGLAN